MNFMLHTEDGILEQSVNERIIEATNNTVKVIETFLQRGIKQGEFLRISTSGRVASPSGFS